MHHPLDQKHVELDVVGSKFYVFNSEVHGLKGVGKSRKAFVNTDKYLDMSNNQALHLECLAGLAISRQTQLSMVNGALPTPGQVNWTEIYQNIEVHDPSGLHRKNLDRLKESRSDDEFKMVAFRYAYFAFGATIPWFFSLFLKQARFRDKTLPDAGTWTADSANFPSVRKYIEALPFKSIGRVVFFTTWPGASVPTHRDSVVAEHKDHNINLFFEESRPSYVWDEVTDTKTYLELGAKSYFFNNRDYHGVDAEPRFRYTLRVDGTFTDEFQRELELEDGYTWKHSY